MSSKNVSALRLKKKNYQIYIYISIILSNKNIELIFSLLVSVVALSLFVQYAMSILICGTTSSV